VSVSGKGKQYNRRTEEGNGKDRCTIFASGFGEIGIGEEGG
jgi:hypothetical protein